MDIKEALLKEYSKAQVLKIAAYINNNPGRFRNLMELFLGEDYRLTQRAAWVLSHCADQHPALLLPYLPELIYNLQKTKLAAVKRNTVRVLQNIPIPEELQGILANICFEYLITNEPVAIKVFAMTVLANLAQAQPDLKNELRLLLEDQLPYASPAFVSRASKLLLVLKKTPSVL
ncbi:hypothetical protein AAE02nite_14280 [Adhaeribacter aerolatus]|uniref:HEAT repeat domain-containing protein n=1 Tax=Adhaeribacter aerolatus TaxID=670289 RepID=A0A512AVN1_9BACT|nr:hypothetical protein [Adhaeribacter aerolatus]GEO03764.1 hypothetical protein AAE02nite_14280 [Adhaeribacter aerolatus]